MKSLATIFNTGFQNLKTEQSNFISDVQIDNIIVTNLFMSSIYTEQLYSPLRCT